MFLWSQSLFMESTGLNAFSSSPPISSSKQSSLILSIKAKQKKPQPLKEGLSGELNVKLLDRVHQIIFILQASPTRIPDWVQKCMFSLLLALQNTVFLSCMLPIPCKGYELNAANPAGNKPLRTAQHIWSQGSATCTCDLLETKLPRVLVFPFNN